MNVHNPELIRQHEASKARQRRLWGVKPKPMKAIAPPIRARAEPDYHVRLFRAYQANLLLTFSMGESFTVNPSAEYCPYHSEIVFEGAPIKKTMRQIALEVLEDFPGITLNELVGSKRTGHLIYPRHLAMYRIWSERRDLSLPMIGKFFNKDHTVILWAVSKIKAQMGDAECIARLERKKERNVRYKLNEVASS